MSHCGGSHWEELLSLALRIMDESSAGAALANSWTLGGGTALMLWAGHRESHDIDIFLDDPQLLAFLDPRLRETPLPAPPDGYEGDGARFLKIVFSALGEIDFICAAPLTAEHAQSRIIGGREIPLERPQEIIAKKIVYRGAQMQPRDMFDIAAALRHSGRDKLAQALAPYQDACARALDAARRMSPDFATTIMRALMTRPASASLAETAQAETIAFLEDVLR